MLLSIIICSIPGRESQLSNLLSELGRQIRGRPVECLVLYDDRVLTIGEKMNRLVEMATGRYICAMGDDDMVRDDYVDEVLKRVHEGTDAITFQQAYWVKDKGQYRFQCFIREGVGLPVGSDEFGKVRPVGEKSLILSEIRKANPMLENSVDYDITWAKSVSHRIKTETYIREPLYIYWYDPRSLGGSIERKRGA